MIPDVRKAKTLIQTWPTCISIANVVKKVSVPRKQELRAVVSERAVLLANAWKWLESSKAFIGWQEASKALLEKLCLHPKVKSKESWGMFELFLVLFFQKKILLPTSKSNLSCRTIFKYWASKETPHMIRAWKRKRNVNKRDQTHSLNTILCWIQLLSKPLPIPISCQMKKHSCPFKVPFCGCTCDLGLWCNRLSLPGNPLKMSFCLVVFSSSFGALVLGLKGSRLYSTSLEW